MRGVRDDGLTSAERAMFGAIATGDVAGLAAAVGEGARLDAANHHGRTALMSAAWHGREECFAWLARREAPDGRDSQGRGARALACVGRRAAKDDGVSPQELGERWSSKLAQELIEACPTRTFDGQGATPLMEACLAGWEEAAASYLAVDDPRAHSQWCDTALMHAAYGRSEACVRLLLPLSNAAAENRHDMSAQDLARSQGRHDLADLIQEVERSQAEARALERAASKAPARPAPRM